MPEMRHYGALYREQAGAWHSNLGTAAFIAVYRQNVALLAVVCTYMPCSEEMNLYIELFQYL